MISLVPGSMAGGAVSVSSQPRCVFRRLPFDCMSR